jgi:hypothetical protein
MYSNWVWILSLLPYIFGCNLESFQCLRDVVLNKAQRNFFYFYILGIIFLVSIQRISMKEILKTVKLLETLL